MSNLLVCWVHYIRGNNLNGLNNLAYKPYAIIKNHTFIPIPLYMIRTVDKDAARALCRSFNRHFSEGVDVKSSLLLMMNSNKNHYPELRSIDAEKVLALFNAQIKVFMPTEVRNMTINIIRHVVTTYINPNISSVDGFQLGILIDSEIVPLKKWG